MGTQKGICTPTQSLQGHLPSREKGHREQHQDTGPFLRQQGETQMLISAVPKPRAEALWGTTDTKFSRETLQFLISTRNQSNPQLQHLTISHQTPLCGFGLHQTQISQKLDGSAVAMRKTINTSKIQSRKRNKCGNIQSDSQVEEFCGIQQVHISNQQVTVCL